ncbi:ABC-type amino acid transport substrate-binding protein [Alteromonadaceae bacterium Bs31]|nr:ABC-type amino acid transport substrate-binding protein [Alteromonadaceae bacterium Bs31]
MAPLAQRPVVQIAKKFMVLACCLLTVFAVLRVEACTLRNGDKVPTLVVPLNFFPGRRIYAYHVDLLQLVLEKTKEEFGACELTVLETYQPINRIHLNIVGGGRFDIVDSTVNPKRDENLLPVRFPIYRGLMGYRVLLIREGDQKRFDKIRTIEDMRSITVGGGFNWFDVKLVKKQNIPTIIASDLETLYRMLPAGRFDAILRGAQEVIIDEVRLHPQGQQLEKNLVLAYPLPVNYYMNKTNIELAKRIQRGLEIAQQDGSFKKLFDSHRLIQETMERVKLEDRHFIYMCNPALSKDIPLDKAEYWYKAWPKEVLECNKGD